MLRRFPPARFFLGPLRAARPRNMKLSNGLLWVRAIRSDSAYQGPIFANALVKILPGLETEIVRRSDHAKGFVRLPKRWIVERTIAWLNRCRRLAKDWENLNRNALAFLKLASILLMLRKLCNA